ncbi:MAG TPA: hypothetical protein PLV92_07775, partial [Pirellulaceae bacterium]|nr:hypothetical protein [Pirellulaceae bacterium]
PPREIVSNDPERERQYTASLIADEAFQSQRFYAEKHRRNYQTVAKGNAPFDQRAIEVKYRDELCSLLGNSIRKSLELDPDCRLARLVRGQCYRTCGQYREALEDFRVAGEPFELFVRGSYEDLSRYLIAVDDIGVTMRGRELSDVAKVNLKPLFAEAATNSRIVGRVAAHSKIRVEQVAADAANSDSRLLLVTAVNDAPLDTPAWIRAEETHWLAEAADVYQPATPMGGRRSNGLPPALARLDEISHNLNDVADRLSEPSVRLHRLADAIESAPAAIQFQRGRAALGLFGLSIPEIPGPNFIRRAAGYAAIPSSYVYTASGYARMPVQVSAVIRGWSGVAADYRDSLALDAKSSAERRQLLSAGLLSPLAPRTARVEKSPWLAATTPNASSEVARAK